MKHIVLFLFIVLCISSCSEENDGKLSTKQSSNANLELGEEGEVSQEAADEAYATLTSLLNDKTRSGSNDIEKWYGGSYINDEGELVICSTDLTLSSKLYIPNTVYEKCEYTVAELEKIVGKF